MDEPRRDPLLGARELLPEAYKDLAHPAATEVGQTLAGAVRVALSPANLVVWTFDQVADFVRLRVKEILEKRKVQADRIRAAPPEVLFPVLQQLRIPSMAESLRELYLNLIATSMVEGSATAAHPAFVDTIRQLTPNEARVVGLFTQVEASGAPTSFPIIDVLAVERVLLRHRISSSFTFLGSMAGCGNELPASSIDNLARLGLVEIRHDIQASDPEAYEELAKLPDVLDGLVLAGSRPGCTATIQRGLVLVTDFGLGFAVACTPAFSCIGLRPAVPSGSMR